jgi:Flp pilus assembly protein TadG
MGSGFSRQDMRKTGRGRVMISLRSLRVRRFVRENRGAAAVEFALVTPLMISMYFGMVELSTGVAIDRKVTMVSHTLSDLIGQATAVNDTDISNVFNAASSIVTPYLATPLTAKITAVSIDNTGKATVVCSRSWTSGGGVTSGLAVNAVVTSSIPAGLIVNNTELIWAQVSYVYTPTIGYVVKSAVTLSDQFFARPRQSSTVDFTNATCS